MKVIVAPAESGDPGEFLLAGGFDGGEDGPDTRGVGGDGFFAEDMFTGADGGFEVLGAESGRGSEQDDVDAAVDEFLIGVESDEAMIGIDLDAVGSGFFEGSEAALELV